MYNKEHLNMSIETTDPPADPLSAKKVIGFILLAVAIVILPSQLTSKHVEVKTPSVKITLGQLEPTANASSLQDLVVTPETPSQTAPEPVPEPVVVETVQTPPPVEKPVVEPPVQPEPPKPAITGSKLDWLSASNIPRKDWDLADWLIRRESSWNPNAQNPNSTAFGLKQFLDSTWAGVGCSKSEAINNPVYQLNCGHQYVLNRYNSWEGAVNFWRVHHWY